MQINPFTLKFTGPDQDLEYGFLRYFYRESLTVFRVGFFLGLVLYSLFAFFDAFSMPEVKKELWKIRFFLVGPFIGVGIILSYFRGFHRYWQPLSLLIILVAAFGIFWMIVIGHGPYRYYYYAGNILVLFFGMAFIRARFVWSLAMGLSIIFMFIVTALFLTKTPMIVTSMFGFYYVGSFIVGGASAYSVEFFSRRNFYFLTIIEKDRSKLDEINKILKKQYDDLKKAKEEIGILAGLIPICANCKKIRDDKGYWNQLEEYLETHTNVAFSHAICPECMERLYGKEEWFRPTDGNNN